MPFLQGEEAEEARRKYKEEHPESDNGLVVPSGQPLISISASELLAQPPPKPRWLIRDLWAYDANTTLAGYAGSGKTKLAVSMLAAVILDEGTFLGFPVYGNPDLRVAYLYHQSAFTFHLRLAETGLTPETAKGIDLFCLHQNPEVEFAEMMSSLVPKYDAFVIDVFPDFAPTTDENANSKEMRDAWRPIVAADGVGKAVLNLTHTPKAFDNMRDPDVDATHVRGAGAMTTNAGIVILYKQPYAKKERKDTRFLNIARSRFSDNRPEPFYVRRQEDGRMVCRGDLGILLADQDEDADRVLAAVKEIQETEEKVTQKLLKESPGIPKKELSRALRDLVDEGRLTRYGKGKAGNPYWYEATS